MRNYKLKVLDYVTSELLILCWNNLLVKEKNLNSVYYSNKRNFFEPLSVKWFEKTSHLIRNGNFNYKIFKENLSLFKYSFNKSFLNKLKFLIIQNAFIFVLRVHFNTYFLSYYNFCGVDILI